jgi:uncharacterized membrane protein YidH (DUF202 family)
VRVERQARCGRRAGTARAPLLEEGGMRIVGILLIIFGALALAYGGLRYTTREKVVDIGPVQATTERHHYVALPPIVGIAAIAGGVVLVVTGTKTRV